MKRLVVAIVVACVLFGPSRLVHAQPVLPAEIAAKLADAAAGGKEALLAAVGDATKKNPEHFQAIVEEATRLRPEMAAEIGSAASAAIGPVVIVPAAGPGISLGPVVLGAAAIGGGVAAFTSGGGGDEDGASLQLPTSPIPPPSGPEPPPPCATPAGCESGEYNAQEGLGLVNASSAYALGYTGKAVIVAVLDSGLDVAHSEFAGRIAPGGFDYVANTSALSDPHGHGTHVSGIVAANRNAVGMHGVAFDSRVLPIRIIDAAGFVSVSDALVGAAFDRAVANGAAVLNNSWGSKTAVTAISAATYASLSPQTLSAMRRAVSAGRIVVFAAGNQSLTQPSIQAGLPHLFPELRSMWVAVVAVDLNGNEPLYTNRCGVAAAWCIAAPGGGDSEGSGVNSVQAGGGYVRKSGTSMAAPHVSGALAVLLDQFKGLTLAEARQRLFVSADRTGIYGNPAIFGNGLLDLDTASQPMGTVTVKTGSSLSGAAFALDATAIHLGGAFGDALARGFAGRTLVVFDAYDAPFAVDLGAFVSAADDGGVDLHALMTRFGRDDRRRTVTHDLTTLSMSTRAVAGDDDATAAFDRAAQQGIRDLSITQRLGGTAATFTYNADPALAFGLHGDGTLDRDALATGNAFAAPYLSFAARGYGVVAATARPNGGTAWRVGSFHGDGGDGETFGAALELGTPVGERSRLNLMFGMLHERRTFLGSSVSGAFDIEDGAPTYFVGVSGEVGLGGPWKLAASAYAGISYPRAAADSLFAGFSPIVTRSHSIGLLGDGVLRDGDRIGLIASQPLRVERGTAHIDYATGRDESRNVFHDRFAIDLEPSGREIDIEAYYDLRLGERARLTASAALRLEPGHVEDAGPEAVLALRFHHAF